MRASVFFRLSVLSIVLMNYFTESQISTSELTMEGDAEGIHQSEIWILGNLLNDRIKISQIKPTQMNSPVCKRKYSGITIEKYLFGFLVYCLVYLWPGREWTSGDNFFRVEELRVILQLANSIWMFLFLQNTIISQTANYSRKILIQIDYA